MATTTQDRVYIDPPTIPAGLTVAEYRHGRHVRRRRLSLSRAVKAQQPTRVSSRAMVI